jgi:predicted DNA-binding transcriptional regulator AlpA
MRLLGKKETADKLGIHPGHLMRLVAQHKFPAPIKLTDEPGSLCKWPDRVVDEWIAARLAARAPTLSDAAP